MKKSLFFLALCLASVSFAAERSLEQASQIAAQFTTQSSHLRKASSTAPTTLTLAMTQTKLNSTSPAYYVFNRENGGFVIVSGDDLASDILAYSDEGTFDPEHINPNFQFWLRRLQEGLSVINESNAAPRRAVMVQAIAPLLINDQGQPISWEQDAPYNNLCPMDDYDDTRCLTGCVATAAAQIMYMWRRPLQGTGTKSYLWENKNVTKQKETLTANFGETTYDWANMLPKYRGTTTQEQQDAVATLMYHCGVAAEMRYGGSKAGGSGSWTDIMGYGMKTYFSYNVGYFISVLTRAQYKSNKGGKDPCDLPCKWSVSMDSFVYFFNQDLEAGRPILMGGQDTDGGHEFVCDGRDANGKFHINWGWGGSSNCYCDLTALRPSGTAMDFSSDIDAVIGIEPAILDTIHVQSITIAPSSLTLKINQKEQLIATIHPDNASIRTFTWSCSDPTIVRVDETGTVKGLAQGTAYVIATTKEGNKKDTCVVTVTNEIQEPTSCAEYSYTFVNKCTKGKNELGEYNWIISLAAGSIENVVTKGQQFGTGTTAAQQVSLVTSDMEDCVIYGLVVNASKGMEGDGQLAVFINQQQVGTTQSLSTSAADYTFMNTDLLQGDVEIRLTNTSKPLYVKSISVLPNPLGVETIEVKQVSRKYVQNGQLIIEYNGTKYSILGTPIR